MRLFDTRGWRAVMGAGAAALVAFTGAALLAQSPRQVALKPVTHAHDLPEDRGAAALWQTLKKLHTRASLIMVTAHPDDEDGGMLTYESRGQGARVALLTLNRGEGGANVMSDDYFDAIGLVRTQELLAAGRYYGVQQYFTRAVDYGFAKTRLDSLHQWGQDRVLYDVVRVIRTVRPLVVTSVFVGGPTDGHGNHQVAGEMAQLAYKMAGDPNVFPDQIKAGLRPWTPLKDYARVWSWAVSEKGMYDYADGHYYPVGVQDYIHDRWIPGQLSVQVQIPEGTYDPLLGLNYVQVSRTGLGMQKTQNGGVALPLAGPDSTGYHRFDARVSTGDHESSFFDGIDTSLMGIADLAHGGDTGFLRQGLQRINHLVEQAMQNYSAAEPQKIAPVLADGLKATNELIAQVAGSQLTDESKYDVTHELRVKQAQFNTALAEALSLSMDALVAPARQPSGPFRSSGPQPTFQMAIPGQNFNVQVHLANQSSEPVTIEKVQLKNSDGAPWSVQQFHAPETTLAANSATDARFSVTVPENAAYTRPYFSRPNIAQPYYDIHNAKDLNLPVAPYPLAAWADVAYHGVTIRLGKDVQTEERITGPGLVANPLVVGPAISVWMSSEAGIVPLQAQSFRLSTTVHSNVKGPAEGTVRLELPAGWTSEPAVAHFQTRRDGEDLNLIFTVTPHNLQQKSYTVTAVADYQGHQYREGYRTVGYQGVRPYFLYRPATYRTTGVNVKVAPGLNVGYIAGSGDSVPESLQDLGVQVHFLSAQDLATGDLSKYNVIVVGIRAYAVRDDLRTFNSRLLDYVKNGGVAIVQYNSAEFNHNYGPYPYDLQFNPTHTVADETSKVQILMPNHPLLNWPNHITEADFNNWVEERGHGFMNSWDPRYQALLEMHDPGQDPQKGGLLYAKYGKGEYVYMALAMYRELPAGVPGAYRIFANLLSLPKNPQVH